MNLPPGFILRPTCVEDAEQVAALFVAAECHDDGKSVTTADTILQDWAGIDLAEESALIAAADGRIAGVVDVVNYSYTAVSVYGTVHPDFRRMGVGRALVDWGEQWIRDRIDCAPSDARITIRHYIRTTNAGAQRLMDSAGYSPMRTTYVMEVDFHEPPPQPVLPEQVVIRTHRPGIDDHQVWETVEHAFEDVWGRPRTSFESFQRRVDNDVFDPGIWFLADAGNGLAGVSLCELSGEQGVVRTLGVHRDWRRNGLGLALLHASFNEFWNRGLRSAWLSVDADSPTGAPRLYTRAGMNVTESYTVYLKEIRPGVDYSEVQGDDG